MIYQLWETQADYPLTITAIPDISSILEILPHIQLSQYTS